MAVVPREVYVTANFKETQLTQLRPGQPVKIEVDPYPDLIALYKALGADGNNRRLRLLPAIWVRSPRWQLTVDLKNVYCRDPARKFFTDGIGVDPLPRATIPALMTLKIGLDYTGLA